MPCRLQSINSRGWRPIRHSRVQTFYADRNGGVKRPFNTPREPNPGLPPLSASHAAAAAPRSLILLFLRLPQNIILFLRESPRSAEQQQRGTSPRRVNGPRVKAHGKHVADTPGGFPHIDVVCAWLVWGVGGGCRAGFTGSQTPAELQWSSLPP